MNLESIIEPLVIWYQENKRDLPWRKDVTAYKVWISEIMLQQTRVEAVKDYYQRFMREVPTIHDLAHIEEDRLLKLWQGLGYYNRARNLKKAAMKIEKDYHGEFPNAYELILDLPGIGSYTAGAISSLAFHRPVPAVDGNVLRVLSRVMGSQQDISLNKTKQDLKQDLKMILKPSFVSDFNQGLMELGALVCLPNGAPKCDRCPLKHLCIAYQEERTAILPIKSKKKKRTIENHTVLILAFQDQYAILKRPDQGLLASMYEFPNIEGSLSLEQVKKFLKKESLIISTIEPLKKAKHNFTHREWHLSGFKVIVENRSDKYLWVKQIDLENYSIPSAFQYYYPNKK